MKSQRLTCTVAPCNEAKALEGRIFTLAPPFLFSFKVYRHRYAGVTPERGARSDAGFGTQEILVVLQTLFIPQQALSLVLCTYGTFRLPFDLTVSASGPK